MLNIMQNFKLDLLESEIWDDWSVRFKFPEPYIIFPRDFFFQCIEEYCITAKKRFSILRKNGSFTNKT